MALYNERKWRQTKDTEQLTFLAGEDLAYSTYVKEDPTGSHIVVESTQEEAIGYVLSPKGVLQGEKVEVHMLRGLGSSPGGPGGIIASLLEDPSPNQNQWQWDNGNGQTATLILDQYFDNVIFVAKNGNDTDALNTIYNPHSMKVPFLTIEAAFAAAGVSDLIWVWPGKYTMTSALNIGGLSARNFHMVKGVEILNSTSQVFDLDPGAQLSVTGQGLFSNNTINFPILSNNNPSGGLAFVDFECYRITAGSTVSPYFSFALDGISYNIKADSLFHACFDDRGYGFGRISIDNVQTRRTEPFYICNDPTLSPLYATYGQRRVYIGGRTQKKMDMRITDTLPALFPNFVIQTDSDVPTKDVYIEINADVESSDGYVINQQHGTVIWNGNCRVRKTTNNGNELPIYDNNGGVSTLKTAKPSFTHNGNAVTYGTYLNNTLFNFQYSGVYRLNGEYMCSGEDEQTLGTPFPCVSITNNDSTGVCEIYMNGVFKTGQNADVGPIRITNLGGGNNELRPSFIDAILLTDNEVDVIYSQNANTQRIFPIHSLRANYSWDFTQFDSPFSFETIGIDALYLNYTVTDYES